MTLKNIIPLMIMVIGCDFAINQKKELSLYKNIYK